MSNHSEDPIKLRVAVSSETGRLVDSHFGKADTFMIYEVSEEEQRHLETRTVDASPDGSPHLLNQVTAIADCDAVVSSRLGPHAHEALQIHQILGVEYPFKIDEGLRTALRQWKKAGLPPKSPGSQA